MPRDHSVISERRRAFRQLHERDSLFVIPNPWDAGSAKVLAALGFEALATTSGGFAGTLGRLDGTVSRDEAIEHSRAIVEATDLPVSADLEHGFADEPDGVATTIRDALAAGLAGCSIEDSTGREDDPIFDAALAQERVRAAAEAAHAGDENFVLTARAENYLHGRRDLADTIARLQSFAEAGADVVYAPAMSDLGEITQVVRSVGLPVNVLAWPGAPSVRELAEIGVRRLSVGAGFYWVSIAGLVEAATEVRDDGTYGYLERVRTGAQTARPAFST